MLWKEGTIITDDALTKHTPVSRVCDHGSLALCDIIL